MSFRPTTLCLAHGRRVSVVRKGRLPVLLRDRVKVAEQKERDYEVKVQAAKDANAPIPPFKTPQIVESSKSYKILRSQNGNLPVYTSYRANGDCSTEIRKIQVGLVSSVFRV